MTAPPSTSSSPSSPSTSEDDCATAMKVGVLLVVSGPAGSGKTTIVEEMCRIHPHLRRSVSYTTRALRPGELEGVDYHYVSEPEFRTMIAKGAFAEHASVHGHLYGTPRAPLDHALARGQDVVLIIDVQGMLH